MKIGIIGINRYAKFLNFACDLHVYAFQQFLEQNGYESTILDYHPVYFDNFNMRHPADHADEKLRKALAMPSDTPAKRQARDAAVAKWTERSRDYREVYEEREVRYDKFEAFVEKNLKFTKEVYDSDLLEVQDPGFDCYMCVTDVIWQSLPRHNFDRGFLLGSKAFEGKQKIAYAASRGASKDYTKRQQELFLNYLDDIDAVSVREADFAKYIESLSGREVPTVLDPTLLHDRDFWDKVATKPKEKKFVLLYYVMESSTDTIAKAVEYAKHHDLTLVEVSDRPLKYGKVKDPDVKHIARYDVGMDEWLGYIRDAEAVFTNSFHGCCFATIFEKAFFVGARNGSKVPNFLATFGLQDRRFQASDDVSTFVHEVDYVAVKKILDERRAESAEFVLGALKEAERKVAAGESKDPAKYEARRQALTYPAKFHSGAGGGTGLSVKQKFRRRVEVQKLSGGGVEYKVPKARYRNDGTAEIPGVRFRREGRTFAGWRLRFRIDNRWFWYLDDGTIEVGTVGGQELADRAKVFADGDRIPHLPVNHVSVAVFVAQWEK